MRPFLFCGLLVACAGQDSLARTPTATTRRPPSLAPPASDSDKERYQLNQEFEDMRDAQQAHREASHDSAPPPPAPAATGSGAPGSAAPGATLPAKKRGPAEQAPAPPPSPPR